MSCKSCKDNQIKFGTGVRKDTNHSIPVKIAIFLVKIVLFLITSVLLSVIIIPFCIYMLIKVFFYDGTVDAEGIILGIGNLIKRKGDDDEDDDEEFDDNDEYEYVSIVDEEKD